MMTMHNSQVLPIVYSRVESCVHTAHGLQPTTQLATAFSLGRVGWLRGGQLVSAHLLIVDFLWLEKGFLLNISEL